MIWVSPMAPFRERARMSPALSTRITACIQCSGTPKRSDASVTKAAKGSIRAVTARCAADDSPLALTALLHDVNDATIATMHMVAPRDRKRAIVLAAVKDEALTRRP